MKTRETLYNTYVNAQKDNSKKVAIFTRDGEAITHGRLIDEINRAAAGLLEYKTGDAYKIGILSSSSYQEAVIMLAASKIGAVTKFIDFTKNITEIIESIAESSISILAIGSEFLPLEPYINRGAMPVIIFDETPIEQTHYIKYKELISFADTSACKPVHFMDNTCAVIINSSGTTGTPKPIELSERAINAAVEKMWRTDYPLNENNLLLKTIPSHIGMGLITTFYTGLITGIPVVYLGGNSPQESIELFIGLLNGYSHYLDTHKLSSETKLLIFGAPMYFRTLFQLFDQLQDLSFIGCMLAGGSAMSKEELKVMDAAFATKGCTVPILNGYGQNEMAGAVTLNQIGMNRRGSAGVAVDGTELLIVDITTGKPVQKNSVGKILERSESLFVQYENMREQTQDSFVSVGTGDKWFNTNDVGYIDDDGFLFITGRTSRIIIRFDMKVSLDKIESKIRESKYIKEVGVISLPNIPYDSTVAFVTLNDEVANNGITPETIIDDIQQSLNPLNEIEKVDKLIIVDKLPYRSSGKIDYLALEKQVEEINNH